MAASWPIKFHTAAKPCVKRKSNNDAQNKMKENIAFFLIGHLGRYLCCFYQTFTFFIGKTDSFASVP
jgi:hypothetical protein